MNDQNSQKISDLIIGISLGDFDLKIAPFEIDEMDAIVTGIYMLSEELKRTTVSRNYFNNIFHSVSDMIFVLNCEGKIIKVNNSVMQLLSCSETELINTSINKLFPESQNEIFKEVSDQFQNDSKIVSLSTLMKYKMEAVDTHCVFSHLHSTRNEDIGFMLIARDIRKIKQYETKYQKIFQESSDAIFIMDKNYQLLEINNACKQLINQEIEMPSILDLFADASEKINFEKALKKNNKIKDFNTKLKVRSGEEINCLISVSRLEEKSGNFQGIIKDISIQKANEAHIINTIVQTEANERKRIAADLHDSLGQQLSAILFYIGTIKGNKKISPENLAEILEKSHNGISNSIQTTADNSLSQRILGQKYYELSNHLGNVLVSISDKRIPIDNLGTGTGTTIVSFKTDVNSAQDYYSFGSPMPGRQFTGANGYRYGFQGQEKDDEIKGNGNSIAFTERIYDPRLGRFLSIDLIANEYPKYSPYHFSSNQPIHARELEGMESAADLDVNDPNVHLMNKWAKQDGSGGTMLTNKYYKEFDAARTRAMGTAVVYTGIIAGIATGAPLAIILGIPSLGLKTSKDIATTVDPNNQTAKSAPDGVGGTVGMAFDKVREKTTGVKSTTGQTVGEFAEAVTAAPGLIDNLVTPSKSLADAVDRAYSTYSIATTDIELVKLKYKKEPSTSTTNTSKPSPATSPTGASKQKDAPKSAYAPTL